MSKQITAYDYEGKACKYLTKVLDEDERIMRCVAAGGILETWNPDVNINVCCHCWGELRFRSMVCTACARLRLKMLSMGPRIGSEKSCILPSAIVVGFLYRYFPSDKVQYMCKDSDWFRRKKSLYEMLKDNFGLPSEQHLDTIYTRMREVNKCSKENSILHILKTCKITVDDKTFFWSDKLLNRIFSWDTFFEAFFFDGLRFNTANERLELNPDTPDHSIKRSNVKGSAEDGFPVESFQNSSISEMDALLGDLNFVDEMFAVGEDCDSRVDLKQVTNPPSNKRKTQDGKKDTRPVKIKKLHKNPPKNLFKSLKTGRQFSMFVNDIVINRFYAFKDQSHQDFFEKFVKTEFDTSDFHTTALTPYEVMTSMIHAMILSYDFLTFLKLVVPDDKNNTLERAFTYLNNNLVYLVTGKSQTHAC